MSFFLFQGITVFVVLAGFFWRLPSKGDIKRLDGRIDQMNAKMAQGFNNLDARIEEMRVELKADISSLDVN